jgi:predicted tellurium resistance membrane protein TerC
LEPATKFQSVLLQIIMIDLVSLLTVFLPQSGMTNGVPGALYMITAVVISVLIMMQFAVP